MSNEIKQYPGRTVFISQDHMLVEIFDDLTRELRARGIEVIRGPESQPGRKIDFPRERWEEWFGRTDVAMFSSRSLATRDIMTFATRLRGIINPTIGLETVDLDAADDLGIIVGHGATPENFLGMAESTIMLMLMMMYRPKAAEAVLQGTLKRPPPTPAMWARMMRHRTIGLVGLGRIGRGIVERLAGWSVRIVACDPYVKKDAVPPGVTMVDLDSLLQQSDIVSLLVAITAESRGMIGERELGLMKPDAYLINTSRGEAIDEAALYRALKEKRIAGAALDTFVVEPLPADSPLRTLDNVILTPHMVGHTRDVYASFVPAAVENITRVLRAELPLHCKNPHIAERWQARLAKMPQ